MPELTIYNILIIYLIGIFCDIVFLLISNYKSKKEIDYLAITLLGIFWIFQLICKVLDTISNIISLFSSLIYTIVMNIIGFIYMIFAFLGVLTGIASPDFFIRKYGKYQQVGGTKEDDKTDDD